MSEATASSTTLDPPQGCLASLRYLGPGLILSAAIVGSGELIATTSLGAKAGFAVLWVILLGCLIKVAVQLQYGRHAIMTGKSVFVAWDGGRGPRILGHHWSVYFAVLYLFGMLVGQGGVMGGAAQAVKYAAPNVPMEALVAAVAVAVSVLAFRGKYRDVEFLSTLFNVAFVSLIVYCVISVQRTQYAFGLAEVASGFSLHLPQGVMALAITAFGITGLSAGEVFVYPTWCIEKGYAAWTGPRDDSPEWVARARGWMRVMTLDALLSMVVYTVATVAFYFLGASVLRPRGGIVDGADVVQQLSRITTEVLGEGTTALFMIGAFMVLFSTLFSNVCGHCRLWIDFFGLCRFVDPADERKRNRVLAVLTWIMPVIWGLMFLSSREPIALVVVLGVTNSIFLLVVAYQAIVFRYRDTDPRLLPTRYFDVLLWLSILTIAAMAVRVGWNTYQDVFGK